MVAVLLLAIMPACLEIPRVSYPATRIRSVLWDLRIFAMPRGFPRCHVVVRQAIGVGGDGETHRFDNFRLPPGPSAREVTDDSFQDRSATGTANGLAFSCGVQ